PTTIRQGKVTQLAHSIWALVNHLAAWVEVVARRITERKAILTPDAGDFPPVTAMGEGAWAATLEYLDREHRKLLDVVAGLDAAARAGYHPDGLRRVRREGPVRRLQAPRRGCARRRPGRYRRFGREDRHPRAQPVPRAAGSGERRRVRRGRGRPLPPDAAVR